MTDKEKELLIGTISKITKRFKYYGKADILRASIYKMAMKYKSTIRDKDVDKDNVSLLRKLDFLLKKVSSDCPDIKRI